MGRKSEEVSRNFRERRDGRMKEYEKEELLYVSLHHRRQRLKDQVQVITSILF